MEQRRVGKKDKNQSKERDKELAHKKGSIYADSNPLAPEQLPDDEVDMEVLELSEDDDDPQDGADEERPEFRRPSGARPLWLLYGGQILWAAGDIHFNTKELEFFRRRLQHLLDFLTEAFPLHCDAELLAALQGFFVRGHREKESEGRESDPRGWISHLDGVGIVFETGTVLPLSEFMAGKGTGKEADGRATGLPDGLVNLWLDRELATPLRDIPQEERRQVKRPTIATLWRDIAATPGDEAPSLTECKGQMLAKLNEFCAKVNERCNAFAPETGEDEGKGKSTPFDLGLGAREFGYNEGARSFDNAINRWKALPSMRPFFEKEEEHE